MRDGTRAHTIPHKIGFLSLSHSNSEFLRNCNKCIPEFLRLFQLTSRYNLPSTRSEWLAMTRRCSPAYRLLTRSMVLTFDLTIAYIFWMRMQTIKWELSAELLSSLGTQILPLWLPLKLSEQKTYLGKHWWTLHLCKWGRKLYAFIPVNNHLCFFFLPTFT